MLEIISGLLPTVTWVDVKGFGESNFVSALFASMAGAFGVAWAAQRIAERAKLRDKLETEVKACNTAIELCAAIANKHIVLKKQHVLKLKTEYDRKREEILAHLDARSASVQRRRSMILVVWTLESWILFASESPHSSSS